MTPEDERRLFGMVKGIQLEQTKMYTEIRVHFKEDELFQKRSDEQEKEMDARFSKLEGRQDTESTGKFKDLQSQIDEYRKSKGFWQKWGRDVITGLLVLIIGALAIAKLGLGK